MNNVLAFLRPKGDFMREREENAEENRNEEQLKRSIVLPAWLWQEVEKDARRCRRSITKQIEAILSVYYDPQENIELDSQAISHTYNAVSQKRMKA